MRLRLLSVFAISAALAALLGAFLGSGWPLDIVAAGLPTSTVAALGSGIVLLAARRWANGATAVLASLVAATQMLDVDHAAISPRTASIDESLLIVWCNVHRDERAVTEVAALATDKSADVVALSETPNLTPYQLGELFPTLPYRADTTPGPSDGSVSRVVILSRHPFNNTHFGRGEHGEGPAFAIVDIPIASVSLTLLAAHPVPPFTPAMKRKRDAVMAGVARDTPEHGRFIVVGDFNTAPWSSAYDILPGRRAGHPIKESTWRSRWPGLGLAIDHILLGDRLDLEAYEIGPHVGSDHLPLVARVRLNGEQ